MKSNQIIFYSTPQGNIKVEVIFEEETFWLSQKRIADLFSVDVRTINEHLQNIYATKELQKDSTIRKSRIVQKEGSRQVTRDVDFYKLDAIIAVGYRVNSAQATQFRIKYYAMPGQQNIEYKQSIALGFSLMKNCISSSTTI